MSRILIFWLIIIIILLLLLLLLLTKDGNYEPEINDRTNRGRAAIAKLNSILWDRDVTTETKTHIYHATVKSTITYTAETWCLKVKTVAKLNSTQMDFWRRSARICRKEKIRNNIIKQKMNVTRSLLDDINTLRTGSFKLFKRPFPGFLTILTL